ncbi:MAG: hypothetical protein Q4A32_01810 [Lachnospiraceae bacterium]|nr:hypothetical protein [Lachnospiraceae bacterium]
MSDIVNEDEVNIPLYQALIKLPVGNICRSEVERPIDNKKYSLWSDGDTADAFATTTAAWKIFKPVNG